MMMIDAIDNQSNTTNNRFGYQPMHPVSATTTADTLNYPMYSSLFTNTDLESDLSYALPVSRKRSRDCLYVCPVSDAQIDQCGRFTFLGDDISHQIQQQQLEIDQFVARHAEKLRAEMEEKRRKLISALDEGIRQIFRAKEEEIAKMMKLNYALEEKVKSLYIENQIWRELAQTKEATANTLRSNLKQVLEELVNSNNQLRRTTADDDTVADDAESCCESSNINLMCKSCGKGEICVLLLPCRHLCLCTICASSVHICPICKSTKNISVHVHMS